MIADKNWLDRQVAQLTTINMKFDFNYNSSEKNYTRYNRVKLETRIVSILV